MTTPALDFIDGGPQPSASPLKLSKTGQILVGLTGGAALLLTALCAPFVSPALRKFCLPYVPATDAQVRNVFTILRGRSGTLLDIGSGDGRIVLEAARNNFNADGVELNLWLVLYSKLDALRHNLTSSARFYRRDLWKYDFNKYDNIVIFGVEQMMTDLERKFLAECQPKCNVVACRFPLPNETPVRTVGSGVDTVWLYVLNRT